MNQVMTFINSIPLRTWIWIGIGVLLLILIILWIRSGIKADQNSTTIVNQTTIPQATTSEFPLKYGSRGEGVKKWQTYLNSKGENLTVDGIWGPLTEASSVKVTNLSVVTEAYFKSLNL